MLTRLRSSDVPEPLRGAALVDSQGLPRYWASVWDSLQPADRAAGTAIAKLRRLEQFYCYTDEAIGYGLLDDALADLDVALLSQTLEGYYSALRNHQPATAASQERWHTAVQFVTEMTERFALGSDSRGINELRDRLMRLQVINSQLHVSGKKRPERVSSLPSSVVEFLYELLDPDSTSNPFRRGVSRWRVYTVFILLLHQGLRRGELLISPADLIKSSIDSRSNEERYWMTVRYNEYEDDTRYSEPSIKTAHSIRQIPVTKTTALIVDEYLANYRGRPNHSFLINSQKKSALSTEGLTKMFHKISKSLPQHIRKELRDHTGEDCVKPHFLRHTAAVVRLNQILSQGVPMPEALQQLRSFFGWSRASDMPLRYARAVFEDRLATVWRDDFDARVTILRNIPARSR